jgi:hypothetical protein
MPLSVAGAVAALALLLATITVDITTRQISRLGCISQRQAKKEFNGTYQRPTTVISEL